MTTLKFTLDIETELGPDEDPEPAVDYVCDWLSDNRYDSRLKKVEIVDEDS